MNALVIAKRDLASYLQGYSAYIIIAGLLLFNGMFFHAFALGASEARYSHQVLENFFYLCWGFAVATAVLLTMRSLADEHALGTEVLLRTSIVKDSEIVEYSGLIQDAASHLLAVINDILDISKIQSGKYTLNSREIDLEDIVSASATAFRLTAQEAGVNLECQISGDLPMVKGDSVKLRQIFTNLISNAIKFTQSGGEVAIEARRLTDGGAIIYVRDTGVGMTEEEIVVALTPFGQVDAGRTRWREGTGLGLPIAKALVELHGGSLEIRSSKTTGTEVSVILPPPHRVSAAENVDLSIKTGPAHAHR